ncbi:MAG: sugar phosphate isomerase/epimerase [Acidobacteria bacterium]|nr:sugar phosphate isomerase/epimerase [Acidobacteriota bacterium]MBS1865540.1 sugar phosphate isomerase/epimerase [Acidobacteriota bacterium]
MERILSTYLSVSRKLTPEFLSLAAENGFSAVEVFCSRAHFDYGSKQEIQALKGMLEHHKLKLASLHAPTSKDTSAMRESGIPLSVCEAERVRRIEAMDEFKRAIDVAEELPFPRMVIHMGGSRESADPRKRDAAFSTLEHLVLHAKHVGVTLCVENTVSEMGQPAYLRAFVEETRLTGLRFNFDIGHAHLGDGAESGRVTKAFEPMRDLVASVHLHDNHGEKDEHLLPYEGSIDWESAIPLLKATPEKNLAITLELKEKGGADAPAMSEQIAAARTGMDRFEKAWN